jgi:hypothetical protein
MSALVGAPAADAQEPRSAALVLGLPGTIGYSKPLSERWDLRADLRVAYSYGSSSGTLALPSSSSWSTGLGVSALQFLGEPSETLTYAVYRIHAVRSAPSGGSPQMLYEASIGLGAHTNVSERLGVFGEFGGAYSYSRISLGPSTVTSQGLQTFGRIGVTLRRRSAGLGTTTGR